MLKEGDIVKYVGKYVGEKSAFHGMHFYVEDPEQYGLDKQRVSLLQITGWQSWCVGFPEEDLEVVGHVEPFETNIGPAIQRDGNFLPSEKRELLAPWI